MYDMYKGNDCGCSSRPEHDHKKDKACDFDSTFLGNGLVRQRETIRITANDDPQTVYIADGGLDTNAKVKIKNLSRNPIEVTITRSGTTEDPVTVGANDELLISSFTLQRIEINTVTNNSTTANVLLCFELLVCTPCHVDFGPALTNDVNPDSKEENI